MQIADYLGQYANTLANTPSAAPSANAATGSSAVQNLVSTLTEMQAGTVFEGSINSIDGQKILLGLGNGQTIAARLDGNLNLAVGQSVFFQVKSNDGSTIAIKPFAGGQPFNPTIQKALDAAGMEMTKDTIDMVNRMMQEGLPIDKNSLSAMRQALVQNPHIPLNTAVMMNKYGIPVNDAMAAQFENYQNDRHEMLSQVSRVMDALPGVFENASQKGMGLLQLNSQVLSMLGVGDGMAQDAKQIALFLGAEDAPVQEALGQDTATGQGQQPGSAVQQAGERPGAILQQAGQQPGIQDAAGEKNFVEGKAQSDVAGQLQQPGQDGPRRISDLLTKRQTAELESQIKGLFPKQGQMKLNTDLTAKEFLDAMAKHFQQQGQQPFPKEALARLFSGKEYHALLKEAMQEQWTVRPEDLKTEHKVQELYERLDRAMGQAEQLAKQAGVDTGQLSQSAAQVRSNIEFMNQINQAYTYVQIPLKMANQNAHSDLYVYTNKRNLRKKEGELSAFLHLDLENLGSTDVSIKMLDKNVSTKFYLANDEAYDLIEAHLPELQERLAKLGYNCKVTVENREEKVDFVNDFLQQSQPSKSAVKGMVHRYSFDVRA